MSRANQRRFTMGARDYVSGAHNRKQGPNPESTVPQPRIFDFNQCTRVCFSQFFFVKRGVGVCACVRCREMAWQYAGRREETNSGTDDDRRLCDRGEASPSAATPSSGAASRRVHARRAGLHHHGVAAKRSAQQLPALGRRTKTPVLYPRQFRVSGFARARPPFFTNKSVSLPLHSLLYLFSIAKLCVPCVLCFIVCITFSLGPL